MIRPTLEIERHWWSHGVRRLAGVDEVGRGALAGPLIAAAVIFPSNIDQHAAELEGITDSKTQTLASREHWYVRIRALAECVSVGVVECDELDIIGLSAANRMAMERAVFGLKKTPHVLLLDAFTVDLPLPQSAMIDGDAHCMSIAAASIVAKVTRDRIMVRHAKTEPRYGFEIHKGYGTADHKAAIDLHGPCALHRRCFAPFRLTTLEAD